MTFDDGILVGEVFLVDFAESPSTGQPSDQEKAEAAKEVLPEVWYCAPGYIE